ncbi:MAG: fused MFS/spermidine synthase [Planctomycetota bacterium]
MSNREVLQGASQDHPSIRGNAAAIFCFFASGFVGLLYEICWIRKACLVFGSTSFAVSTVIAVFFGGLALGNYVFGRYSQRAKQPLMVYAFLQSGVGVLGILSPLGFILAERLYGSFYPSLVGNFAGLVFVRFVCVCVLILAPTFLMGGTLPLFCRQYVVSKRKISLSIGLLYGLNTLGAGIGCALAGFYLIGVIGVNKTIWLGGALNIIIWLVVSQLEVSKGKLSEAETAVEKSENHVQVSQSQSVGKLYITVISFLFFLSGFVGLGNEILLTRYMSLLVRNTVYTYTLMLTIVLMGIVLGSFIISFLGDKIIRRGLVFGTVQICVGLCVLAVLMRPVSWWAEVIDTPNFYMRLWTFVVILLVPAILSGISFPLAIRMVVGEPKFAGIGVGRMTALNTFGGILGSLVMGFIALPMMGIQISIVISTGISLFIGLCALVLLERNVKIFVRTTLITISLAVWVGMGFFSGTKLPEDFLGFRYELIDFKEGINNNLSVVRNMGSVQLHIDRLWQGERKKNHQIMAAHVPMILHNEPKDVLVIGLGVGQTASRFLMYDIERLVCVDIEDELVELVRRHFDSDWLDDERCEVIIEDGRNYLMHTPRKYDVISLEVGQVFRPGLSSFYTVDFYERTRAKLKDGGIVCQFAPIDFFGVEDYKTLIRSFIEVFPSSILWYNRSEFLLIGFSSDKINLELSRLDLLSSDKKIEKELRYSYWGGTKYWLNQSSVFLGGFLCGPEGLGRLTAGSGTYHDDVPKLEYLTAKRVGGKEGKSAIVDVVKDHIEPVEEILDDRLDETTAAEISLIQKRNLGDIIADSLFLRSEELRDPKKRRERMQLLEKAVLFNPDNYTINSRLASEMDREGKLEKAIVFYEKALSLYPDDATMHYNLGVALQREARYEEAIEHVRKSIELEKSERADAHSNLGSLLYIRGDTEEAVKEYQKALEIEPKYAEALYNLGSHYFKIRMYAEAEDYLRRLVKTRPKHIQGHYYLGKVLFVQNKQQEGSKHFKRALELAEALGQEKLAEQIRNQLKSYKK